MNLSTVDEFFNADPLPSKKAKKYIMAYKCPRCLKTGYFNRDFIGTEETIHGCGQVVKVMSPEME